MIGPILLVIYVLAAGLRVASIVVSRNHEKELRASGAIEYGAFNSKLLAAAHGTFYMAGLFEAVISGARFDQLSAAGLVIYVASMLMLVWIVRLLGPIWTVKIMIAPLHRVSRHMLFRYVRHPNYILNIIPELIGYAMIFHAGWTLAVGLPIYLAILTVRIAQEERAMTGLL